MKTAQTAVIAAIVLICSLLTPAQPTYSGGDGSSDNPYQVSTTADWVQLTDSPEHWDKHFVLTTDIDLADISLTPVAPDTDPDMTMFQGIVFSGVFDGQGYMISNAVINKPNHDFIALFGCVGAGGHIHNLRAENVFMTGRRYVAGLVAGNGFAPGDTVGGTITDCHVSGTVTGTYSGSFAGIVGGLCGDNFRSTISNCSAAVSVVGGNNISAMGGLCAWNWLGTISSSYAVGSVSGGVDSVDIGGFCGGVDGGSNNSNGSISHCFAAGDVSGYRRVGGFVGYNNTGTLQQCYSTGKPKGTFQVGGFCGSSTQVFAYNVWDIESSEFTVDYVAYPQTTARMKRISTFLYGNWDISDNKNDSTIWTMPQADYPQLAWQRYSGGSGIAGNPYQIGTIEDWLELIDTPQDWNRRFVLINDIDFAGIAVTPIAPDIDPEEVNHQGARFTGVFDGQGFVLKNAVFDMGNEDFAGFYGALGEGGEIRNLGIENVSVVGRMRVGGLCGHNFGGTIQSCFSTGSVGATFAGDCWAGGLVGATTHNGIVEDCFSTASVSGDSRVGGLAGQLGIGVIRRSYATGNVTAVGDNVGGLTGVIYDPASSGTIRNCYATGNVSGSVNVGGLVGNNFRGKVIHCYSTGKPTGTTAVGGLCGTANTGAGYEDTGNLWNTTTSETTSSAMGFGRTASQFQTVSTFQAQGWNFLDMWWMPYDDAPRLQWEQHYSGGSGDEADPYRISKITDWLVLSNMPNHWDKHFVLICDIDFGGKQLTPIGRDFDPGAFDPLTLSFTGVFDGKGHRVCNATIQLPHNGAFGGLFGHIREARIENLGVQNISVSGSGGSIFLGGLCGYNESSVINNCFASGVVTGGQYSSYIGGLCGMNNGAIKYCYAQVEVNAEANTSFIGGLTGCNLFGSITDSFTAGKVTGSHSSSEVGGLAGSNAIASISNSYATGDVTGGSGVGGFVGFNNGGSITHCFSTGKPTGIETVGGFCGELGPQEGNLDMGNFWDMESSGIDASAMGSGKTTAEMETPGTFTAAGWDPQFAWRIAGGRYPRLFMELRGYSGGKGTTAAPYRIGNVIDWLTLCSSTDHWDKTFVLTGDIDFTGVELIPVASDTDPHTDGFQGVPFTGILDGQGFALRNPAINLPDRDFVGLFGELGKDGYLSNLRVENAVVTGASRVGGLVGRNDGGDIHHCRLTGSVAGAGAGSFPVGGLAGVMRNNGMINNSSFSGAVAGESRIGGLVGYLFGGLISQSFAAGQVTGSGDNIGGLVGYHLYDSDTYSRVDNCYASVRVIGGVNVGGLIGQAYQGTVTRCYSTGRPTGTDYVGGVFGRRQLAYSDYGVFWDIETSQTSYDGGGFAIGRPTFMMKKQATYSEYGWNFDRIWAICEDSNYPRLRWQIPAADWVCPDGVRLEDFAHLAAWWLADDCADRNDCDGTDLNLSGHVGLHELLILTDLWLQ